MVHSSTEIANVFHAYYSTLYKVNQRGEDRAKQDTEVYEYLWGLDLPMVPKEGLNNWKLQLPRKR